MGERRVVGVKGGIESESVERWLARRGEVNG